MKNKVCYRALRDTLIESWFLWTFNVYLFYHLRNKSMTIILAMLTVTDTLLCHKKSPSVRRLNRVAIVCMILYIMSIHEEKRLLMSLPMPMTAFLLRSSTRNIVTAFVLLWAVVMTRVDWSATIHMYDLIPCCILTATLLVRMLLTSRSSSNDSDKSISESVDEIVIRVNKDLSIVYSNKDLVEYFSKDGGSMENLLDLYHFNQDLKEQVEGMLSKMFETGEDQIWEWTLPSSDSELTRQFTCKASVILDEELSFGATIVITETTEHYKAQEQERLANEMKVASKYKSEFLASMSHEIRNPLNGILGSLELLSCSEPLTDVQSEHINDANDNAKLLMAILSDILDMSKIESGRLELSQSESSILEIVETVGNMVSSQAYAKKLALHTKIDCNLPVSVICDKHRISQILLNFASNAIKFTTVGEVVLSASLLSEDEDKCAVRFTCTDTGVGVQDDDKQKIFQPFVQGSEESLHKRGWGLGLQICYRLAKLMNGEVGVQENTAAGHGSVFYFTVELNKVKNQKVEPPKEAPSIQKVMPIPDYSKVVLLLQDEQLIQVLSSYCKLSSGQNPILLGLDQVDHIPGIIQKRKPHEKVAIIACTTYGDQVIKFKTKNIRIILLVKEYPKSTELKGNLTYLRMPVRLNRLLTCLKENVEVDEDESSTENSPPSSNLSTSSSTTWPEHTDENEEFLHSLEVLVVEDNDLNRKILSYMLKKIGILNIDLAVNGQEAVDMVTSRNQAYSIIFMDLFMPVLTGFQSTSQIRSLDCEKKCSTPIVALTGNADSKTIEDCHNHNFTHVLTKPVSIDQLLNVIKRYAKPSLP